MLSSFFSSEAFFYKGFLKIKKNFNNIIFIGIVNLRLEEFLFSGFSIDVTKRLSRNIKLKNIY